MATDFDETQLTAFALNELPEAERGTFTAEQLQAAALQQQVAEIQSISDALTRAMKYEHAAPLSARRMLSVAAEVQRSECVHASGRMAAPWRKHRTYVVAAAIVMCAAVAWTAWAMVPHYRSMASANNLIRRLESALMQYKTDFGHLPPDTGFGLPTADLASGAGRTYDAGSLWRYLGQEIRLNGKSYGPYMRFRHSELSAYDDPVHGKSFFVVDPWGTAVGYVGDSRRVIHNQGSFDLFSAGPDRKTGKDLTHLVGPNMAYDGVDNDGDGVADNAAELGSARLNGCLTMACNDSEVSRDMLDDLNNWDR